MYMCTMFGTASLIFALLGIYCYASPINEDYCRDGQGVYVAETYLPCSLLVEANDSKNAIYGVFTNRVELCRTAVHDCCRTCGHILQDGSNSESCVDEPASIWLADSGYDCAYLLEPGRSGNAVLGIYKNRLAVCSKQLHQCCRACQTVYDEEGISIPRSTTTESTPTAATETSVDSADETTEPDKECQDQYVPLGDQRLDCGDLILPGSPVYVVREKLCQAQIARCCVTCSNLETTDISYKTETQLDSDSDSTSIIIIPRMRRYNVKQKEATVNEIILTLK